MNRKAFYRAIKWYKRRSSGFHSPSTPNRVVPPTGHTPSDQLNLQFIRIFYWAYGVASISYIVKCRLDMEPLAKELILDGEKDARVMSHGGNKHLTSSRNFVKELKDFATFTMFFFGLSCPCEKSNTGCA